MLSRQSAVAWLLQCLLETADDKGHTTDGGKNRYMRSRRKANPQLPADGQWFTVGQADAVDFTGNYTTGPLSLGGNPCSSLEYMKQGKNCYPTGDFTLEITAAWSYHDG